MFNRFNRFFRFFSFFGFLGFLGFLGFPTFSRFLGSMTTAFFAWGFGGLQRCDQPRCSL